jgi:hypothetical protein
MPDTLIHGEQPGEDREVQLAVMVPDYVKRAVRRHASRQGTTLRGVLLSVLCDAGIIPARDLDLGDRRATAALVRARPMPEDASR